MPFADLMWRLPATVFALVIVFGSLVLLGGLGLGLGRLIAEVVK